MNPLEAWLIKHLCPVCHVACLAPYPEAEPGFKYLKCVVCGFTKEEKDE